MLNILRRWTPAPIFDDDEKTRVAALLYKVLISLTVVVAVHALVVLLFIPEWQVTLPLPIALILLQLFLLTMLRRGYVRGATLVFCCLMWFAITFIIYHGGIGNPAFGAYGVMIVVAGLLLGDRAAVGFSLFAIFSGFVLALAETNGLLPPARISFTPILTLAVHAVSFSSITAMLVITVRSIQAALQRARASECALAERNTILEGEIARREQAEEAYRALVEHSIQGLFIQQDGRIVFANQAELDLLGYSLQQLTEIEDLTALVHPDDRAFAVERASEMLAGETTPARYEVRIMRQDGALRWQEIFPSRIVFRDKPAIQAAAIDITERKQSEQQQLELRLAREKAELLSAFISDLSHDFATPLSVINTSLHLLERVTEPERQRDRLNSIKEQVQLLERQLDDILTSSRLEHLPLPSFKPVDLNRLLNYAIEKLRPISERKNITITLNAEGATLKTLADENELNRAFTNLLENAVKYTPKGGRVSVRARTEVSRQLVEIEDNGIGIDADDLPHIFDRFYRSSGARSSGITGTGLGLAIVRQIIEIHGGTIEVSSELGQGSIFSVRLSALEESRNADAH